MRVLLSAIVLFTFLIPAANADPREDALAIVEKWSKAFTASDVEGIVKLYAPDATFLGTSSKTTVVEPEGIRGYFESAFLTKWQSAELKSYAATSYPIRQSSSRAWIL
jgi:hypothetical protein